jgi:hypothetical protein
VSRGPKFVSGDAGNGRLKLVRDNGSVTDEVPSLILIRATLTDNGDSTFDLVFDGS